MGSGGTPTAPRTALKLEKWQRVFVNRSMNMKHIKAVGFDMDHTLVLYNRHEFESLAFVETVKKMVQAGYPEELLLRKFDSNFLIRGLLVDMDRGNLLKVDGHKYVKMAFHGTRQLDKETRHKLYNSESFRANEFLSVDTFFALSEVQLFSEIVDYMEKNPSKIQKTFREVYADIRYFIDLSHADGSIKSHVTQNPERFVNRDKYLSTMLVRYRDADKYLFLLTNSQWEFTNCMMEYILDNQHEDFPKWRDYFDLVVVGAGKPGFFNGSQPFYEVMPESNLLKMHSGKLQNRHVYQAGNAALFQKLAGFRGDEILYVGDHIFGDIMQSKGKFNWRTALMIEELDSELRKLEQERSAMETIQEKTFERELLDEQVQILRSKIASMTRHIQLATAQGDNKKVEHLRKEKDKTLEKMKDKEQELEELEQRIKQKITEHEQRMHPVWGELMKVGSERSRFAYQVELFACIYTTRASNFRFYSPLKQFRSFHDILPHDV